LSKSIWDDINSIKRQKSVRFANYLLKHLKDSNKDLNFINHFYGLKVSQKDIKRFKDFLQVIKLKSKGYSLAEISMLVGVPKKYDW